MLHSTSQANADKTSGVLDYHRIDPETIGQAIAELNRIADAHAILLQHDQALAGGFLHYENLLIDAQGGDHHAFKQATSHDEFDKLLDLAEEQSLRDGMQHDGARDGETQRPELEYLALREDLMQFHARFLPVSRAN